MFSNDYSSKTKRMKYSSDHTEAVRTYILLLEGFPSFRLLLGPLVTDSQVPGTA